MRVSKKEIRDQDVVRGLLAGCHVGRLGTIGKDGYPMTFRSVNPHILIRPFHSRYRNHPSSGFLKWGRMTEASMASCNLAS